MTLSNVLNSVNIGTLNCSKIITSLLIAASVLLLTIPLSGDASAHHFTDDTKWQLVYLASDSACSNYNYQMTNTYDEVVEKYLGLYQLDNSKYDPLCFPQYDFKSSYVMPQDVDLLIIVYDRNLGESELHMKKLGGFYTHSGQSREQNHVVVLCDCSNFVFSDPIWVLTHELSHFVLYYLNYDQNVVEKFVHSSDKEYDKCREFYTPSCSNIAEKMRIDTRAYSYAVVPPYWPAVGAEIQSITSEEIPENMLQLNKVIAKWWTEGKITEGDYSNVLGFMMSEEEYLYNENSEVFFADDPIDDSITWQDLLNFKGDEIKSTLLDKLPYDFNAQEKLIFMSEDISGLPDWFKQTAEWWAAGEISDEEFVRSVDYLRDAGVIRPQ